MNIESCQAWRQATKMRCCRDDTSQKDKIPTFGFVPNAASQQTKARIERAFVFSSVSRLGGVSLIIPLPVESVSSANGGRVGRVSGSG